MFTPSCEVPWPGTPSIRPGGVGAGCLFKAKTVGAWGAALPLSNQWLLLSLMKKCSHLNKWLAVPVREAVL